MNQIRPRIWLGSCRGAANLKALRAAGVTAVLNVAWDFNDPCTRDIKWFKVGLTDDTVNPPWLVETAVNLCLDLIRREEVLYVHCLEGQSRGPFVLAHAMARNEGKTYDEIWADLRRCRERVLECSRMVNLNAP